MVERIKKSERYETNGQTNKKECNVSFSVHKTIECIEIAISVWKRSKTNTLSIACGPFEEE